MKEYFSTKRVSRLVLLASLIPAASYATNGMFLIGNGNKSRGMGGTGIALQLDSLSAIANPATIAGMEDRFDIGMDIFRPQVESQLGSVSDQSVASVNGLGMDSVFFMPAMAITYQYNNDITLGFTMAAAGGGGTKFKKNFFEAANAGDPNAPSVNSRLGVDLIIMEMAPTIAYKVNEKHSVAASLVIGVARFEAYGLGLFSSFTPSNTTNNMTDQGKDWSTGAGARIGWLGNFGDFSLGAQYTSKIFMRKFDLYSELFAEGGDIDVPANMGVGASFKVKPELTLAMDITHTFYEDVPAIGNKGPNLAGDPAGPTENGTRELGTSDGMGFGWENQTVYKLGAQYQYSEKVILRGGWNYGKSPINEDREIIFNLLAPASVEHHITMGGTYILNPSMEINVSYIHAFKNEQAGPTYISDDGSNYGRLQMSQDAIGGSFSMKY
jgi:long-chain fatty acid transport protein